MAAPYDLVVIGGGSGGLACSKTAAELGARVAVLDFVKPSPMGTTWGLGGTCVNVGCIPKKLMHQAAILGKSLSDARDFGWDAPESPNHTWNTLVSGIQDHIGSLNWGYRVELKSKQVEYINAYGSFVDAHTIRTVNKKGQETLLTAKHVVIATGGRPRYPDIPGAREHGISSDDLFSLRAPPGKTLVVGASYVALECAGFLEGLGYETTVMVRSILLRGFDQEIADRIGADMEERGVRFIRGAVPTELVKEEGGRVRVRFASDTLGAQEETFDTVLFAIGRDPCTSELNLAAAGITSVDKATGKLRTSEADQTNVPHIFAIGDVLHGKPELTPVAIKAGQLLAGRLFGGSTQLCDYVNVPTTVFTPLEYGSCGLGEAAAIERFGQDNVEVYLTAYTPLEYTVPHRKDACYAKIICHKADNMRVLGFHVLGPNAGEITQGFAIALRLKATKADFDSLVGIHPTCAEVLTTMKVTRSSGQSVKASGC